MQVWSIRWFLDSFVCSLVNNFWPYKQILCHHQHTCIIRQNLESSMENSKIFAPTTKNDDVTTGLPGSYLKYLEYTWITIWQPSWVHFKHFRYTLLFGSRSNILTQCCRMINISYILILRYTILFKFVPILSSIRKSWIFNI